VVAMLIIPGTTAYLLTDRFRQMLVLAPTLAAVSAVVGIYVSFYLDTAPGGMVVLTMGAMFVLVYVFSPRQGLLGTRLAEARRRRAAAGGPVRQPAA
jgi:manganese transport system permease protein